MDCSFPGSVCAAATLCSCGSVHVCLLQPVSRSSLDISSQGQDCFGARSAAGVCSSPLLTAGAAEDSSNSEGMAFVTQTVWQSYASPLRKKHHLLLIVTIYLCAVIIRYRGKV